MVAAPAAFIVVTLRVNDVFASVLGRGVCPAGLEPHPMIGRRATRHPRGTSRTRQSAGSRCPSALGGMFACVYT